MDQIAPSVAPPKLYREAFFNGRFEMASAQAIILFVIMMIVTLLQFKFEKKGVHYQ